MKTLVLPLFMLATLSAWADDHQESAVEASTPVPQYQARPVSGEANFARLINHYAQGKPTSAPWAGYWWPYKANGTAAAVNGSSPMARYDAARGEGKAEEWEIKNHGSGLPYSLLAWWGHDNGWASASLLFPEPREPVTVNGITFSVADIKAILSEACMGASADFFGERYDGQHSSQEAWDDVVPDQYFLVLTNYIGMQGVGVAMDRYTGDQVWNVPVAGYRFEYPKREDYLGEDPQNPGRFRIRMKSRIWWAEDSVDPNSVTPKFEFEDSDPNYFSSRELGFQLWLDGPVVFDSNGKIISSGNITVNRHGNFFVGGKWDEELLGDQTGHPDYMWVPYSCGKSEDFANPNLDLDWIRSHLLVPGGRDDHSVTPIPLDRKPSGQGAATLNWSRLELRGEDESVQVLPDGTLSVDKNLCDARPASKPIVSDWSTYDRLIRTVGDQKRLTHPYCFPRAAEGEFTPTMDLQAVSLITSGGEKRKLLRFQETEICSYIGDPLLTSEMVKAAQRLASQGVGAGCNYASSEAVNSDPFVGSAQLMVFHNYGSNDPANSWATNPVAFHRATAARLPNLVVSPDSLAPIEVKLDCQTEGIEIHSKDNSYQASGQLQADGSFRLIANRTANLNLTVDSEGCPTSAIVEFEGGFSCHEGQLRQFNMNTHFWLNRELGTSGEQVQSETFGSCSALNGTELYSGLNFSRSTQKAAQKAQKRAVPAHPL